jgi:RHS repeat-associated protein
VRLTYGANATPSKYTYDHAGRAKTLTTWRSFNVSTGIGNGSGDVTTWNYNDAGLLKSKRHADNKGPDYTYDQAGRLKTREWARSVGGVRLKTTYNYDAQTGNINGVDYSDNTYTADISYGGFDRLGRPSTVADASGSRSLSFSGIYPTGATYTAGAFPGLNVAAPKDGYGRPNSLSLTVNGTTDYAIYYTWKGLDRLENIFWYQEFENEIDPYSFQDFSVHYDYEANSNLVSEISYSFYDSYGEGYSAPGLAFTRSHDKLNRVRSLGTLLDDDDDSSLTYAYNDRNQRSKMTSETGAYWAYTYDSDSSSRGAGQVTGAVRKNASGAVAPGFEFGYSYDGLGNRTSATANGSVSTYYQGATGTGSAGGNALNQYGSRSVPRLLDIAGLAEASSVWVNGQSTQRLGEHWFKRLSFSGDMAQWPTVTVSDSNGGYTSGKVLLKGQPEVYAYDDDGNQLSDGRWVYVWDMENRLSRMETGAVAIAAGVTRKRIDYAYDDRGRRVLKTVYDWNPSTANWQTSPAVKVGFAYDEWNLLAEFDLLSAYPTYIRKYIWGTDISGTMAGAGGVGGLVAIQYSVWNVDAVGSDANGNVVELIDMTTGQRRAHYDYDAFGNAYTQGTDGTLNPFRFSTKYTEADGALSGNETGLVYYGFRYYNPSTGRWPNRDPIEEPGAVLLRGEVLVVEGALDYAMNRNDPVNVIDYLGMYPLEECQRARQALMDCMMSQCANLAELEKKAKESCNDCAPKCKPCNPIAGTRMYRVDDATKVRSTTHHWINGKKEPIHTHHNYVTQRSPYAKVDPCKCEVREDKDTATVGYSPAPGEIPQVQPTGGGF